jgi:heme oxygenase-like protein
VPQAQPATAHLLANKGEIVSTNVTPGKPILRARPELNSSGDIELHTVRGIFDIDPVGELSTKQLLHVLQNLDGRHTLADLPGVVGVDPQQLAEVLEPAVTMGLVDDLSKPDASSGLAALSRLEHVLNELVDEMVFRGPFWRAIAEKADSLPANVFYGFGLENWFFLYNEALFDAPVVSHPTSAAMRAMLQEFYYEEHRHDDIVVRAFAPLGISKDDLLRARPLPTTTALINMLAWWSRTDPLFFIATIGILEGRLDTEGDGEKGPIYDSFLEACDRVGLQPDFVHSLRTHAKINAGHDHSAVSREIFAEVVGVDPETERRWRGKAHLFVETYAGFFNGLLDYYSRPDRPLVRTAGLSEG